MKKHEDFWNKEDVVYTYTRGEAIEDGVLVDISGTKEVQEAGFRVPVAMTSALWDFIQVPKGMEGCQDLAGRLWDVCFLAGRRFKTVLKAKGEDAARLVEIEVIFHQKPGHRVTKTIWLCFNEYEGFTLMFPEDY